VDLAGATQEKLDAPGGRRKEGAAAPAPGEREEERMGSLAEELVAIAARIGQELDAPRVARVLVPPEGAGPDHHASFCAVQLADGSTGLAYVLLDGARRGLQAVDPAALAGARAEALAEAFTGADAARRSLALAAMNALTRHLLARAGFAPEPAASSLGALALRPGERLGMVGFFPPLVRQARDAGVDLTVLELKEELVQRSPGLEVTLDPARLAGCAEVVCTSTTLLNGSLEALLAHARGAREFVLLGPSAGCPPDPLFARGVTATGGAWVADPDALLARAARGERWGDASRKFSLRRAAWPGLEALLRQAAR
jgi:uncharacterized protein (DUF4213/DUF364 family)